MINTAMEIFDPCINDISIFFFFPVNFIIFFIICWLIKNSYYQLYFSVLLKVFYQFGKITYRNIYQFLPIICLIFFLIVLNTLGLVPYVYSLTRIMRFSFCISFFFFFILRLNVLSFNLKNFLIHLTPFSRPLLLVFFLVPLELMGFFIRPLTLGLRLIVNIIAGHVIVSFFSRLISSLSILSFFFFLSEVFVSLLESCVCLIQGYVFGLLLVLYIKDMA